jgi:hypothetical protein
MTPSGKNSQDSVEYERADLVSKGMNGTATRKALQCILQELKAVPSRSFSAKRLREAVRTCAEQPGAALDAFEHTLRVAIVGRTDLESLSLDIYATMALLGKMRTLGRIEHAIGQLMVTA